MTIFETPRGVVKVFVGKDGRVIAHAADFEQQAPGGFTRREAQEIRCRRTLAYAILNAFSSPVIAEAIEPYDAEKIVNSLTKQGYKVHTIDVGDQS